MAAKNIDEFNEITGKVFATLYEAFPIPTLLRPSDFGIDESHEGDWGADGRFIEGPPRSHEEVLFSQTVQWLEQSGYLTVSGAPPGRLVGPDRTFFGHARLTAKGLEVMNAIPPSLTKREPI